MSEKEPKILCVFSREVLDEERLSMSRILVRRAARFQLKQKRNLDFKYNYTVYLIIKLKYL